MIYGGFLQRVQLIRFTGGVSYNNQGYAVLPPYTILPIFASVQPLSNSEIRRLPEGTHYADYATIDTDFPVDVDNTENNLGDYFVYLNKIYKIMSAQQFTQFSMLPNRQTETTVARDNRLIWDATTSTVNLPYPQIDTDFACFFDFITLVKKVFEEYAPVPRTSFTVLWMNQLELRAPFPFCAVNIESVTPIGITNYRDYDGATNTLNTSRSNELEVSFNFYAYDRLETINLLETFKLCHERFQYGTTNPKYSGKIGFLGFVPTHDGLNEEVYENRTIFSGSLLARYNFISQISTVTQDKIESMVAQFNYRLPNAPSSSAPFISNKVFAP